MSAISSVGSSSSAFYLTVQADAANSTDDASVDASSTTTAAGGTGNSAATTSPLADFRSQIETAVTSAVNQLPTGSSPQDIFNAVRSAVEDTLKANGLDLGQLAGHRGGHHHHHASGVSDGTGASDGSDGDGDANQPSTTDPLLTLSGGTSSNAAGIPGNTSIIALFATGPSSTGPLASVVQQLTGGTNTQNSQTGSQSGQSSPLFTALQNAAANGLDLSSVFQQLFQGFPNGTGLDVQA